MLPNAFLAFFLLLSLIAPFPSQKPSDTPSQNPPVRISLDGARIFQRHCATCHGVDGRGHGPASLALKQPPPDLTLISQRSGGKFPYRHIKEVIAGPQPVTPTHTRDMPAWGPIFHQVETDQDWGEVRLDSITKYVGSIQHK